MPMAITCQYFFIFCNKQTNARVNFSLSPERGSVSRSSFLRRKREETTGGVLKTRTVPRLTEPRSDRFSNCANLPQWVTCRDHE